MQSDRSPLGHFSLLPPEIRFMIWDYFYPQGIRRCKTEFAILRTSSTLYHEIISYLKWPESLGRFEIDMFPSPDYPFLMYNASRSVCWEIPAKWFSDSAGILGFDHLPVDKLGTVLNIPAPIGGTDPGEIISIYEKCLVLVKLFNWAKSKSVKSLSINLHDTMSTTWICRPSQHPDNVHPVQSLPVTMNSLPFLNGFQNFRSDDIAMVMNPFFLALRVSNIQVTLGVTSAGFAQTAGYHTELQSRMVTDQQNILQPSSWKIAYYESRLSLTFLLIQTELDSAHGPMANLMRLKRFVEWSEEPQAVEDGLLAILYRCRDEIRQGNLGSAMQMDIWTRFGLMRLVDPKSNVRHLELNTMAVTEETEEDRLRAGLNEVMFGEASSADAWHRAFSSGIPAFSHPWWNYRKFQLSQMLSLLNFDEPRVRNTFVGELFTIQF
ncbi:hypothetical protein UA08_03401 [Talaromyces atroroseus]|uniref:Uncharacterized protein n=1 Tax=Talaromyces atroroseus TaxID=1441469 RepID=A0A225AJ45_TALAT|nr:hypothetical protein UA08_03401 [Talaromyces atroroseus]OKL61502.1 hypothetical protein UA08_03401 [Talaromyces atroroseus]